MTDVNLLLLFINNLSLLSDYILNNYLEKILLTDFDNF